MKEIKLTKGFVALVDDEDFERANQFHWRAQVDKRGMGRAVYARRSFPTGKGKRSSQLLHRFVLELPPGRVPDVDHKDHNGLNCQKDNLRIATVTQNQANKRQIRGISPFKGVCWSKVMGKWVARVQVDRDRKVIGYFDSELEAAKAYDVAAFQFFGDFASPNFARVAQSAQQ